MRSNPRFALDDEAGIRDLVRANPWATIVSFVPGSGLVVSHYPVLLDEAAEGIVLLSHVGRPDERLHELGQHEVVVIFYGPQGYISPGWYDAALAVPTWNFEVAHLYGVPELFTGEENLQVLEDLVEHFEKVLPEPFLMNGTRENAEYAARIERGTVGFRLRVTRFEAKSKMSQNKPAEVIDSVIAALADSGPYHNPALAARIAEVNNREMTR